MTYVAANPFSWTLHLGIHRGTLTSQVAEQPKEFSTLDACRSEAAIAFRQYRALGCKIWFGYAIGPDGEHVSLLCSEPYE